MIARILIAAFAVLLPAIALAQTPAIPYTYPISISTASVLAISVNPSRRRIEFYNPNDTVKVAVCPTISRTAAGAIACTVNGAGSITLLPYQSYRVDGVGGAPQVNSAWNAIGSGSGGLTIFEWE
jgi:hypothetical protein